MVYTDSSGKYRNGQESQEKGNELNILIACEESQTVCKEFRKRGHHAYSCDLLPTSGRNPEWLSTNGDWVFSLFHCIGSCSNGSNRKSNRNHEHGIYRKPDQIIQPYYFGDPERKSTCLWLKGLQPLKATNIVEPAIVTYKSNGKTDSLWHYKTLSLPPNERSKQRSKTFPGIAKAMASQWG